MATTIPSQPSSDELPDTRLFWVWVGRALRPYVGWICAAVGFLVIIIGWFGVSGQALVAKQLPYLISGGLGGVALVGIGAAMISAERRRQDTGRIERLEEMVGELRAVLLAHPDAPTGVVGSPRSPAAVGAALTGPSANGAAAESSGLVALPTGTTYHAPGCQMVRAKEGVEAVNARRIEQRGLAACRVCEPLLSSS
jgi:hypothetical protein